MSLLTRALWANVGFSSLSGLTFLAAGDPAANLLGELSPWIVRGLGVGLLLFALYVAGQAREPDPRHVRGIIVADVGWVVGSAALLALSPTWLSGSGAVLVLAVAGVVGLLATLQILGLRRTPEHGSPA